jgi:6-phosphogluconolactonase/glucosamine-6-phosphate isomerase/deaminase
MEVLSYPLEDVLEKTSGAVNTVLEREFGAPLLFLVSGGSSLLLLNKIHSEFLGAHIMIAVSDERFSPDPKVNNFAQVAASRFYENAKNRGCSFVDTRPSLGETVVTLGERFNRSLKDWRAKNPQGRVVMTQGIGPDGHTCGIMPFPEDEKKFAELFLNADCWAVGYDAKGKNEYPLRVTATLAFLREQVDESVVYAVGGNKQTALRRILKKEQKLNEVPGFILREMKKVAVFTDQRV